MITSIRHKSLKASAVAFCWLSSAPAALAMFGSTPDIGGSDDIEGTITDIIKNFLNLMALLAVVIIVIAGVRMVVSQGEQEAVEKSKKTILFAIIGLIVILLARAIVQFVADFV
ncbi:MAG: TrbC/VirB2 family protein [Candidatus Peribacteraceae bacterium]|mgnify:FL=1|jgi:type IV secretory pathway VirB2 component (pilin)|nr:TrbC/VirB2 family protein [Candidatus Peribacteraceae bacterium]MDP7646184.1 TrbC/VirB2 family protein [Candidatus Peribacteraceae bacterium]|tara:strand:+ start:203 stop:544 length:342 start_codon:yes stop_codon:yes gene_type:complete